MAEVVASYQLATFTSPTDGDSPISATTVKGNDNTIRGSYNSHDADPGIHLQSSVLASRPAAATVGRKWLTTDGLRIYYDTGAAWSEIAYLSLAAGGTVAGATTFSAAVTMDDNLTVGGTAAVTGISTITGGARTGSGTTVCPDATTTALFASLGDGAYIITFSYSDASNYGWGMGIDVYGGGVVVQSATDAALVASGSNFAINNTSGASKTVKWTYIFIPSPA